MQMNVFDLFYEVALKYPKRIAVRCKDYQYSYSDLLLEVVLMEDRFIKQGVYETSKIAIAIDRDINLMTTILTIFKLGAILIPLDKTAPKQRNKLILANCKPDFMIADQDDIYSEYPQLDIYMTSDGSNVAPKANQKVVDPNRLAYILYTSGSTGIPKGVCITHKALSNYVYSIPEEVSLNPTKPISFAFTTSISFDIFFTETILPLCIGDCVVLFTQNEIDDPRSLTSKIKTEKIEVVQFTPSKLWQIYHAQCIGNLEDIQILLVGGEQLDTKLYDILMQMPLTLYNMYGPTETTIWSTISNISKEKKITIGHPILDTRLYILDEQNNEVDTGELCIAGSGLAVGYYDDEELTGKKFVYYNNERIYHTGDLVESVNGDIFYLRRLDNQVKVNGIRVELSEIEGIISQYKGIAQVVAKVEQSKAKKLIIYYTSIVNIDHAELTKYLKDQLLVLPSQFFRVENMILTPSGKIDRQRLNDCKIIESEKSQRVKLSDVEEMVFGFICSNQTNLKDKAQLYEPINTIASSLDYIKIVTALEEEYDIEIEDEYLNVTSMDTILSLIKYVSKLVAEQKYKRGKEK